MTYLELETAGFIKPIRANIVVARNFVSSLLFFNLIYHESKQKFTKFFVDVANESVLNYILIYLLFHPFLINDQKTYVDL